MEKIVIFGATGGIGSAIARRLNGKGYPLHLVARDQSKKEELSQKLNAIYTLRLFYTQGYLKNVETLVAKHFKGIFFCLFSINMYSNV